jgi:hypothetical protein
MGPIRSISGVTNDLMIQRDEVRSLIRRLREANRRLTGSTGEAPTPLAQNAAGQVVNTTITPPLLVQLTVEAEYLAQAVNELRYEVGYLEQFSETGNETTDAGSPAYQDSLKYASQQATGGSLVR